MSWTPLSPPLPFSLSPMLRVWPDWANHSPSLCHPCCVSTPFSNNSYLSDTHAVFFGPIETIIAFSVPPMFCVSTNPANHSPSLYHLWCWVSHPIQPTAAIFLPSMLCVWFHWTNHSNIARRLGLWFEWHYTTREIGGWIHIITSPQGE